MFKQIRSFQRGWRLISGYRDSLRRAGETAANLPPGRTPLRDPTGDSQIRASSDRSPIDLEAEVYRRLARRLLRLALTDTFAFDLVECETSN